MRYVLHLLLASPPPFQHLIPLLWMKHGLFYLILSEINDILQTHKDMGVRYVFYSLDFSRIRPHFPPGF